MKYFISYSTILLLSLFFMFGCADTNDNLTQPEEVNIHGSGTFNPHSQNYHPLLVKEDSLSTCQTCHAADFSGGVTGVSCATENCHPTIDVHMDNVWHPNYLASHEKGTFYECQQCHGETFEGGIASPSCATCHTGIEVHNGDFKFPSGDNFHGKYIADNDVFYDCAQCHGEGFTGGKVATACTQCHTGIDVHKDGIMNPGSDAFHAKFIAANDLFQECTQCHGEGFEGGLASPSCATCHTGINVHKDGILNPGDANFHGKFLQAENWNLSECQACHGEDYSGGDVATTSCLTCHTQVAGPEACNTCHGNFNDIRQIAPPEGTHDETSTTAPAVGAHQSHLINVQLMEAPTCADCHKVPGTVGAEGHIDGTPRSELIFGQFANSGPDNANYNFDQLTCQNTYCHGDFEFNKSESAYPAMYVSDKITGNNSSPVWNKVDGTQAQCGTCHGTIDNSGQLVTPLPEGHYGEFELSECAGCHISVVDASGNIIDKEKHINGKPNVFGN